MNPQQVHYLNILRNNGINDDFSNTDAQPDACIINSNFAKSSRKKPLLFLLILRVEGIMELTCFSYPGEYVAVCGKDGRLRIWETATSILKQEFIPSSHLTATCTCLEWTPSLKHQRKTKKVTEANTVVMGTALGSLLFYDVRRAALISQSNEAHAGQVTGLAWSSTTLFLYSCGEDGFILEWDVEKPIITRRWKGCKTGLSSAHVFHKKLLTGGHEVSLWDLKTKTSTASFTGHPNRVIQIASVPSSNYFLTMGQGERFLKIWSTLEKNSIATLSVPDMPVSFSLSADNHGRVIVSVVTCKGRLHLFQHKLNGPIRKPISPEISLKMTECLDPSKNIPILASFLQQVKNNTLLCGYGSWVSLRFESFDISTLQKDCTISREFSIKSRSEETKYSVQKDLSQIPSDVKHLLPGTDEAGLCDEKLGKRRRMNDGKGKNGELPMEERLSNLTLTATPGGGIRENNLASLLSQGIRSKDSRILQSVLSRWDEDLITNTVRSLPVQLVAALLTQTKEMLTGKGQLNNSIMKWIKIVIKTHSSYLMCCTATEQLLVPFMLLLHTREILFPRMCQLKGKLELIKGSIEAKQYRAEPANEALLVFNDESGDEMDDEDMIPSDSDEPLELYSDDLGVENNSSADETDNGEIEFRLTDPVDEDSNEGETEKKSKSAKSSMIVNVGRIGTKNKKIKGTVLDEDVGT